MTLLQSIVMGVIQGLTEFLPVSSSGHLVLFKILFHVDTDTGLLFDVLLHVGTLIAVCVVYYKDILRMAAELMALGLGGVRVALCNLGDGFVTHGSVAQLRQLRGIDPVTLAEKGMEVCRSG